MTTLSANFDDLNFYYAPEDLAALMAQADGLEIGGCRDEGDDERNVIAEPCGDAYATYWSVYAHVPEQGVSCIADFRTRDEAEAYAATFGKPVGDL